MRSPGVGSTSKHAGAVSEGEGFPLAAPAMSKILSRNADPAARRSPRGRATGSSTARGTIQQI